MRSSARRALVVALAPLALAGALLVAPPAAADADTTPPAPAAVAPTPTPTASTDGFSWG
ncbi:hypothetical protein ACFYNX_11195 [Streptomyces sp. NPDC007872]|uniref:hypothetical protein n=1 Tax=unclassified Streptomyces TaxID=2593676 RepID=UPI003426F8F4